MSAPISAELFETDQKIGNKILLLSDQLRKLRNYLNKKPVIKDINGNSEERLLYYTEELLLYLINLGAKATIVHPEAAITGEGKQILKGGTQQELEDYLNGRSQHEFGTLLVRLLEAVIQNPQSPEYNQLQLILTYITNDLATDPNTTPHKIKFIDNDLVIKLKTLSVTLNGESDNHEIKKLQQKLQILKNQLETSVNNTKYLPDPLERLYSQQVEKKTVNIVGTDPSEHILEKYVFGNKLYKHTTSGQGSSETYQKRSQRIQNNEQIPEYPDKYKSMQQTVFEQHGDDVEIQQPIMNLLNNLVGNLD